LRALESFKKVVAPYSGIVTARTVDRGALITAGSGSASVPLFRLAQIDTLRIFVNVPQTFVRSIAPGQEAKIVVREFPGREFSGKVSRDANALDPTSRTLLTEVLVPNTDLTLRPGMYAQVKFSVEGPDPPVLIPATALVIRADGPQVALVRDDHTVHFQKVELGRDLGTTLEVVSGLSGDERLVVNIPDGLKEGITVRPQGG
jgi:RND family efflux transporter MFP subunit